MVTTYFAEPLQLDRQGTQIRRTYVTAYLLAIAQDVSPACSDVVLKYKTESKGWFEHKFVDSTQFRPPMPQYLLPMEQYFRARACQGL